VPSARAARARTPAAKRAAPFPQDVKLKRSLLEISDRLSCATFGLANTVTAMFYAIENTTQVGPAPRTAPARPCTAAAAPAALPLPLMPPPLGLPRVHRAAASQGCVEGGEIERPVWLDVSVHLANTAVAWVDLLIVEQRSFCGRSRHLAAMLAVVYCAWLLLVRQINGKVRKPGGHAALAPGWRKCVGAQPSSTCP
jgi:hypothetical protein